MGSLCGLKLCWRVEDILKYPQKHFGAIWGAQDVQRTLSGADLLVRKNIEFYRVNWTSMLAPWGQSLPEHRVLPYKLDVHVGEHRVLPCKFAIWGHLGPLGAIWVIWGHFLGPMWPIWGHLDSANLHGKTRCFSQLCPKTRHGANMDIQLIQ